MTAPAARAQRVAELAAGRDLDALLVTDLVNVRWLTGFSGSNAAAVVGPGGQLRFVTDFRYLTLVGTELDDSWERAIAVDLLAAVAAGFGAGELALGFDDAHLSVKDHRRLGGFLADTAVTLEDAGGLVEELRAVKDPGELDAIRAAARLADDALTEVLARGLVGRTEREVALDLEFTMRRLGAEGVSFPSIVAAGDHGALPHADPRD
jgi:Xaa-Pro aminopeptidase